MSVPLAARAPEPCARSQAGKAAHRLTAKVAEKKPHQSDLPERTPVSLWVRLLESHNVLLAEIRRRLSEHCTLPRFDLLANLERQDGQTLASLSRRMLVTAGNLTGLVDRAERDGVVERRADPRDRRLSRVYLTPSGRSLITNLLPLHERHVAELLRELAPNERRDLRRLLGRLRDSARAIRGERRPRYEGASTHP
jgi:DNA-binding MarR family transcriptional regulator